MSELEIPLALAALERDLRIQIALVVQANLDLLRLAAAERVSCERAWLVKKLADSLGRVPGVTVRPEVSIRVDGRNKFIDLVLTRDHARLLLEVKSFPTNYGLAGKPITQFRDGVISDLVEVGRRLDDRTLGFVLWLAYPIPDDRDSDWRITHFNPINRVSAGTDQVVPPVNLGQAYAHVYLSRACPSTS